MELVAALEAQLAATRVPVQGEPNDELIEYALDYIENGTMRPERRKALQALASRATVPDAATELAAAEEHFHASIASHDAALTAQINEAVEWGRKREAERDAALAVLERIREAVSGYPECNRYEEGDVISCGWKSAYASVVAALDGAPEPEWEEVVQYGNLTSAGFLQEIRGRNYAMHKRVVRFGPVLPAQGESDE